MRPPLLLTNLLGYRRSTYIESTNALRRLSDATYKRKYEAAA